MLRTVTNIIMVTLLLISTTGVAISKHYCKHDLISVELNGDHPCCDDAPCCDTETEFLQVKNDFLTPFSNSISEYGFTTILNYASTGNDVKTPEKRFTPTVIPDFLALHDMPTRLALFQVYRL